MTGYECPGLPDCPSELVADGPLERANGRLVALVERPLPDALGRDETRARELLQVRGRRRLGHPQLLGDGDDADAVADEIAVALRREVRLRVLQPLQHLQPLRA